MNRGHRFYEELCALAMSGVLDEREFAEFKDHADQCEVCLRRWVDLSYVGSQLSQVQQIGPRRLRAPKGMLQRFVAQATRQGVPLREPRRAFAPYFALASLALAILAALPMALQRNVPATPSIASTAMPETGHSEQVTPNLTSAAGRASSSRRSPISRAHASSAAWQTLADAQGRIRPLVAASGAPTEAFVLERIASNPPTLSFSFGLQARAFEPWSEKPETAPVFVLQNQRASCNPSASQLLLWDRSPAILNDRHVFCYNPNVASLHLLDLFHATALNAIWDFNLQGLTFRIPPRSLE